MARLAVRLTPRGGADAIDRVDPDGTVHARVSAPPAGSRANAALVRLLAGALRVPPSSIDIVSGARGRNKVVEISGLGEPEVRARLAAKVSRAAEPS